MQRKEPSLVELKLQLRNRLRARCQSRSCNLELHNDDGSQNGQTAKEEYIEERVNNERVEEIVVPFLKFDTAKRGRNLLIGLVSPLTRHDGALKRQIRQIIELAYLGTLDRHTKTEV